MDSCVRVCVCARVRVCVRVRARVRASVCTPLNHARCACLHACLYTEAKGFLIAQAKVLHGNDGRREFS